MKYMDRTPNSTSIWLVGGRNSPNRAIHTSAFPLLSLKLSLRSPSLVCLCFFAERENREGGRGEGDRFVTDFFPRRTQPLLSAQVREGLRARGRGGIPRISASLMNRLARSFGLFFSDWSYLSEKQTADIRRAQ